MKIRPGFVSNSSSSSFIVGFETVPETIEDMQKLLFGEVERVEGYDHSISASYAAEIVLRDLEDVPTIRTRQQFFNEVRDGYFDGYPSRIYDYHETNAIDAHYRKIYGDDAKWTEHPDWSKDRRDELDRIWAEERENVDKAAWEYVDKEWPKFKGLKVFVFIYADDDGEVGSTMEHGGVFRKLTHVVISHH